MDLVGSEGLMGSWWSSIGKRAIDIGASLACCVVLSVPMGVVWVLIRLSMGPPVILKQPRPGLDGSIFQLYKFRSMTSARGADDVLLPDEQRMTDLGRFLRRTSLDELPELFNVLLGEMSLVGPRPLLVEYLDRYTPEQARRHDVRPGITGWVQVNGRNALSWEEKFALDVWYVDNWTIGLDIRILWMTILQTIRGRGVSAQGYATMPEFTSNQERDGQS
jgi:sugar transferase EpsL